MFGTISIKDMPWYRNLKSVFAAIDNSQLNYNWLISYPELNTHCDILDNDFIWMTGEELTTFVNENQNIQWIWAVLSGFEKNIAKEDVLKYKLDEVNEYHGYYNNPIKKYHPLSCIEIAPSDSSWVVLLSKNKEDIDNFKSTFNKSVDLIVYNAK